MREVFQTTPLSQHDQFESRKIGLIFFITSFLPPPPPPTPASLCLFLPTSLSLSLPFPPLSICLSICISPSEDDPSEASVCEVEPAMEIGRRFEVSITPELTENYIKQSHEPSLTAITSSSGAGRQPPEDPHGEMMGVEVRGGGWMDG